MFGKQYKLALFLLPTFILNVIYILGFMKINDEFFLEIVTLFEKVEKILP